MLLGHVGEVELPPCVVRLAGQAAPRRGGPGPLSVHSLVLVLLVLPVLPIRALSLHGGSGPGGGGWGRLCLGCDLMGSLEV